VGWFVLAAIVLAVGIWVAVAVIPNTGRCPEGAYPNGFDLNSCKNHPRTALRVLVSGVAALIALVLIWHAMTRVRWPSSD
jgi:hypothetical protein